MNNENQITPFTNTELNCSIEVVTINNEPWFVAKSVCDALELSNARSSVALLDDDEKGVHTVDTLGGIQTVSIINESGLYSLILRSRKLEAKRFKKWVTSEVLPSIRKHGGYLTPQKIEEVLLNPDTIIKLATDLKEEREKSIRLETKVAKDKPKVLFCDAVVASESSILIGQLAKYLKQNGVDIGQNRLFKRLREDGYLVRQKGENYNLPTQKSMELGLFEIKKWAYVDSKGTNIVTRTVKVTGRGQVYFVNRYLREANQKKAS